MSLEGLNQHFNAIAMQFVPSPFPSHYTSTFKRIRILDSTAFHLPDVFSSVYSYAGGAPYTFKKFLPIYIINTLYMQNHYGYKI
ncbi:hypothetical protein SAMN04487909_13346 [Aneurinibacillus migulanus]|uniref:Transposase DDE domain-containing protein n=1 Tax=Aneurinibacillus migulanus TaxID=47500 RepID=A0A1G8XX19_ANEMI|nr:hypothetical protein AMI01nite_32830 [Aneurinibacillus migulanus]SDJ94714.1 hypothetical protein SAMN04487909_13346 [Aneurinibacillus migulanus]